MKKLSVWATIITFALLIMIIGCSGEGDKDKKDMPAEGMVHISPSSLFDGETKKLEPHLGLTSGAVKVQYEGPRHMMIVMYEIWENGTLKQKSEGLGYSIEKGGFDGEFSVSLREEDKEKKSYAMTTVFSKKDGYASSVTSIPGYKSAAGSSPRPLQQVINVSDKEEIPVWGWVAGKGSEVSDFSEPFEEMAKKVEWALLLKIHMKEE
ncbi:hypothetical protein P9597_17605 [Aneurinibacillus migulanus]|uniref:hypothetical protein n=1 Tax=Aneurinibacillus migulanus TaxID=47500 RepID=UPI002E224F43|nr:hypothetical protein [Aneurinibacillus migulanus]